LTYARLEDAVINALKDIAVRELKPYGGELSPERLTDIAYRFPAIFVFVSEMRNETKNRVDVRTYRFNIYAGARSLRKNKDAVSGAYELMEAARERLHRKRLIDGFTPFRLIQERVVGVTPEGTALMEAVYETEGMVRAER